MYVSALLVTIQEEELDLDAIAKEWLAAAPNCPLLLVTRGSQGTVAYRTGKPTISVALEPVKVVDTVRNGGAAIEKLNLPLASPHRDFLLVDTHLYIDSLSSSLVVERASVHGACRCAERCVMDIEFVLPAGGRGRQLHGRVLGVAAAKGPAR